MSTNYDNWERLVAATLRREHLWLLFHSDSRTPSISSRASEVSSPSPLSNVPLDFSTSSSWYPQNSGGGYSANGLEVNHIVKDDKLHEVNELTREVIFVNGKLLYPEQLTILLSCPHPPKKLKPGYYWYDKVSGFWGKQGQKPAQIISPNLYVGGSLDPKASNGNTLVYINNREITKVEMRMLKLAGVTCSRHTHIWMYDDGAYQLEGQSNILGSIWNKAITKLLCSVLSLPFPPKSSNTFGEQSVPDHSTQRSIQQLRLIGCNGSGTSTIFKQAMFLYKDIPFSEDELEHITMLIQGNTFGYFCLLLEGRKHFEEENLTELRRKRSYGECGLSGYADDNDISIYSLDLRLKYISERLLRIKAPVDMDNYPYYLALFEELWSNAALQETLKRRSELKRLPSVADYFFERVTDIVKSNYKPSHLDIICAEAFPSSHSCMDFSFPPSHKDDVWDQQDFTPTYQLIYSPIKGFGDSFHPLEMYEDAAIVIFTISLTDYDQLIIDDNGASVNKMMFCRNFFASMVTDPIFDHTKFLLLLTKYDLFDEKVKNIPLNQCEWFNDFNLVLGRVSNMAVGNLGQMGFHYIAVKFKSFYASLTGKKLYVVPVNGLE